MPLEYERPLGFSTRVALGYGSEVCVDRKMRRTPKQERAQATVDAILEAAAQLLVAGGMERLSTNRIAKRAGVSVGTLYQYFPDKEAVVVALGERVLDRQFAMFERDLLALLELEDELEDKVRALVRSVLDRKRMEPELSRALLASGTFGGDHWKQEWLRRQRELVRSALHVHRDKVRPGDLDVMTYVITTCFEFVVQDALLHHPHLLRDGRLADEIAELAVRYLSPDP